MDIINSSLFKENDIKLPNNIKLASHRLQQLKSRLERDEKYKKDYVAFMNEMIRKGYAEREFHHQKLQRKKVNVGIFHIMVPIIQKNRRKYV